MIKKDIIGLFKDFKLFCFSYKNLGKKNLFIFIIILALYTLLFCVDPIVRKFSLSIHNDFLDFIFGIAHWYGKPYLTLISFLLLYLSGILFNKNKLKDSGWKIFESFAISGIIVTIIKSVFGRWRPYTEHGHLSFVFFTLGQNDHLSLPSGDVAIAFSFSTIVASFIENKLWKIFWFALAVLTSLGRIYHDQHWLTDVILAAMISLSVGFYILNQKIIIK